MSGRFAVRCLAACLAVPALAGAQPAAPGAEAGGLARGEVPMVVLAAPGLPLPAAGFCSVTLRCAAPAAPEARALPRAAPHPAPGWRSLRRGLAFESRVLDRAWRPRVRLKFHDSWFGLARPLGGGRLEVGYRTDGRMEAGLRQRF